MCRLHRDAARGLVDRGLCCRQVDRREALAAGRPGGGLEVGQRAARVTTGSGVLMGIIPFTSGETYTFDTPPLAPIITSITTDYVL